MTATTGRPDRAAIRIRPRHDGRPGFAILQRNSAIFVDPGEALGLADTLVDAVEQQHLRLDAEPGGMHVSP